MGIIMALLMLLGVVALNLFISWLNCRSAGYMWAEAKRFGGFMRVLVWCAAIQSVVGFSSALILILGFTAFATGHLPKEYLEATFSLWYLLVIFPALGSGLIITIHSFVQAWRERNIASVGTAAYNAFAMGSNIYNAVSDVPDAFGKVGNLFKGDKDQQKVAMVLLIVAVAIGGGVLITMLLIRHYARAVPPEFAPVPA
jgi:hypothetical protein